MNVSLVSGPGVNFDWEYDFLWAFSLQREGSIKEENSLSNLRSEFNNGKCQAVGNQRIIDFI